MEQRKAATAATRAAPTGVFDARPVDQPLARADAAADLATTNDSSSAVITMTQVSFGGLCGWCAGMAGKHIGKTAAVALGTGFIALQLLSYNGYVSVNWQKMEADVMGALDLNKDGKVDQEDLRSWFKKGMKICQYNMPSSAGFAGGFVMGVRYG
eukprot:m.43824 g.43824  ORF g.43824 m.43824 type:complete len:155 (-) comp12264_c0_seq1:277-741(-)